jgi:hypothetical protein
VLKEHADVATASFVLTTTILRAKRIKVLAESAGIKAICDEMISECEDALRIVST